MQTKRGVWLSAALLAICACHDTAVDGKEPDAPADAGVATRAAASDTAGDAGPAGRDAGQSQATQTSHAAAASGSAAPDTSAAVDAGMADAAANAPVEVASPKEAAYCKPHDHIEEREAIAVGQRLLNELSPEQREVFWQYEVEERSMPEIARMLGCPLQTAYARLHRARQHMVNAHHTTNAFEVTRNADRC